MAFSVSNAGKALTSYNLLIFIGAFFLQWIIGLIIDLGLSLNYSEIASFQLAMSFVLVTSLTSYLYFLVKNN
jgi:membrane protein implicated in regulation of membrane protease activity